MSSPDSRTPKSLDDGLYQAMPPLADEFSSDEEPLMWEGEGWETPEPENKKPIRKVSELASG